MTAPTPFLLTLAGGAAIGVAATLAVLNLDRIAAWLSGLWDDQAVDARRAAHTRLTVVHGEGGWPGRGRGHCTPVHRRRDPTVRLYDFETDGGGGAA